MDGNHYYEYCPSERGHGWLGITQEMITGYYDQNTIRQIEYTRWVKGRHAKLRHLIYVPSKHLALMTQMGIYERLDDNPTTRWERFKCWVKRGHLWNKTLSKHPASREVNICHYCCAVHLGHAD